MHTWTHVYRHVRRHRHICTLTHTCTSACNIVSVPGKRHAHTNVLQAGQVRISTEAATVEHLAQQFWHRILALADLDDDQQLSLEEFQSLIKVFELQHAVLQCPMLCGTLLLCPQMLHLVLHCSM